MSKKLFLSILCITCLFAGLSDIVQDYLKLKNKVNIIPDTGTIAVKINNENNAVITKVFSDIVEGETPTGFGNSTLVVPTAYGWWYSPWSQCSNTCGDGVHSRTIQCKNQMNGQIVADAFCTGTKLDNAGICQDFSGCTFDWKNTEWTTCQADCTQTRTTYCERQSNPTLVVGDGNCGLGAKPVVTQSCSGGLCCPVNTHLNNGVCEPDIQVKTCENAPANATLNTASINWTWNGTAFAGNSLTPSYSASAVANTCTYTCNSGFAMNNTTQLCEKIFSSCNEIKTFNTSATNGTYNLHDGTSFYKVYCDMTTDGGGWTLVMTGPASASTSGGVFAYGNASWDNNIEIGNVDAVSLYTVAYKSKAYSLVKGKRLKAINGSNTSIFDAISTTDETTFGTRSSGAFKTISSNFQIKKMSVIASCHWANGMQTELGYRDMGTSNWSTTNCLWGDVINGLGAHHNGGNQYGAGACVDGDSPYDSAQKLSFALWIK